MTREATAAAQAGRRDGARRGQRHAGDRGRPHPECPAGPGERATIPRGRPARPGTCWILPESATLATGTDHRPSDPAGDDVGAAALRSVQPQRAGLRRASLARAAAGRRPPISFVVGQRGLRQLLARGIDAGGRASPRRRRSRDCTTWSSGWPSCWGPGTRPAIWEPCTSSTIAISRSASRSPPRSRSCRRTSSGPSADSAPARPPRFHRYLPPADLLAGLVENTRSSAST